MIEKRKCNHCKKDFDLTSENFNKDNRPFTKGFKYTCISCQKIYRKAHYEANRQHELENNRKYLENPPKHVLEKRTARKKARGKEHYYETLPYQKERKQLYQQKFPELNNARRAKYRASQKQATPSWANQDKINSFYKLAKIESEKQGIEIQVDHIVPLKSEIVCGLHCEANLQLLPKPDNVRKSNRTWPDMPS